MSAIEEPQIESRALETNDRKLAASRFGDHLTFLSGFVAQPMRVASVWPSSRALERQLVRTAGLAQARTVVELGPGTGGTTRALLRALPADARLLAVEQSAVFSRWLRERIADPRLLVPAGADAEHLAELLRAAHLPAPDAVLSGIPFSTLPEAAAQRIARAVAECLAPGGRFVAYQMRDAVVRYVVAHLGPPQTARWQWLNVPPMRVFCWTKPGA